MKSLTGLAGLICLLLLQSCGPSAEDALQNDNFVRWSRDQVITYDLFEGDGPPNAYSAWIGVYFISDLTKSPGEFFFNVTIFLDKKKSFASRVDENSDVLKHRLFPTLYKLKFDYYEIHARKFRMYLLEHKSEFTTESTEDLELLLAQYYQAAEDGWNKILEEIDRENDFNEEHFRILRKVIDIDLEEFKEFDDSVNNYHLPPEASN